METSTGDTLQFDEPTSPDHCLAGSYASAGTYVETTAAEHLNGVSIESTYSIAVQNGEEPPADNSTSHDDNDVVCSDDLEISDTSDSDIPDTSDSEEENEAGAEPLNDEIVFLPHEITDIEEICECEHTNCQQWKEESVMRATKDAKEEMQEKLDDVQEKLDDVQEKLDDAQKQLKRKDCLLGEKVLSAQKMRREIDDLRTQLSALSQTQADKQLAISSLPQSGDNTLQDDQNRLPTAVDEPQPCELSSPCCQDSSQQKVDVVEDTECMRPGCQKLSLMMQFQKMALVANQNVIRDLQQSNDSLSAQLKDTADRLSVTEADKQSQQVVCSEEEMDNSHTEELSASPPASAEQMNGDEDEATHESDGEQEQYCGNCIVHQQLLASERQHVFKEVSNILQVCQETGGAESEVLVAKLHCDLATRLQTAAAPSPVLLPRRITSTKKKRSISRSTSEPGLTLVSPVIPVSSGPCQRCLQLSNELFDVR